MSQDIRSEIDAKLAASDIATARVLMEDLWREHPGPATAGFISKRMAKRPDLQLSSVKVAILRSFTVEPIVPIFTAACLLAGIEAKTYIGSFNAYAQEILDRNSALYAFAPDVVFLAVQTRDIAPELWSDASQLSEKAIADVIARVSDELDLLARRFREHSGASLVIHNLDLPLSPSAGLVDAQQTLGQSAAIRKINEALLQLSRNHAGVYILDYDGLISRCGREAWYDERKWQSVRLPIKGTQHHRLADEWVRFLHPITGRVAKVLVLDLDNTLWGGVVGEDGLDGIQLGPTYPGSAYQAVQRVALDLYARGVILAVASKNNYDDAMEALERHPGMLLRPHHFAALKIDWNSKAENLRAIAKELNVGIDSLVFVDDNPAECGLIRSQVPEVRVVELKGDPEQFADRIRSLPLFERLKLSNEDRERGRYYAEQRQRVELEQTAGSLESFLSSLKTEVEVERVNGATAARVAQLTQKTNQFNLTNRRYSEQEVIELSRTKEWTIYSARARDRFGDHGLIGVVILRRIGNKSHIDNFLLSCRVISRGVETAMMAMLADHCREAGAMTMSGEFITTKKNKPAADFFTSHGFVRTGGQGDLSEWSIELKNGAIQCPAWVKAQLIEEKAGA